MLQLHYYLSGSLSSLALDSLHISLPLILLHIASPFIFSQYCLTFYLSPYFFTFLSVSSLNLSQYCLTSHFSLYFIGSLLHIAPYFTFFLEKILNIRKLYQKENKKQTYFAVSLRLGIWNILITFRNLNTCVVILFIFYW